MCISTVIGLGQRGGGSTSFSSSGGSIDEADDASVFDDDDDDECSDVFESVRQAHGARASCETGPERL